MEAMELIKQLRDETGVSVMDCKRALDKAGNDLDKARIILKEEGLAKADKKADRETKAGAIATFVSEDSKNGAIIELRCETDFVAKNEEFLKLADNIAKEVALNKPTDVNDLLLKTNSNNETVDALIRGLVAKIGEKMEVSRFNQINTTGYLTSYIHVGSRLGVLLEMNTDQDI
jgi:elongation factor Ts